MPDVGVTLTNEQADYLLNLLAVQSHPTAVLLYTEIEQAQTLAIEDENAELDEQFEAEEEEDYEWYMEDQEDHIQFADPDA